MSRWTFTDPNDDIDPYEFDINPSDEDAFGKERNIEHGANTANTGLIKQQSDDSPLVMQCSGTILKLDQVTQMWLWWNICNEQTIFLTDFAGDEYEGLITSFQPTRHRTIKNPRDFANAPLHYWKYELKFEVVRVISGPLLGLVP